MSESATCSSNQAILDVLLTRWSQASGQRATAAEDPRFHMWQARHTIEQTLSHYLPWMDATDKALYDKLTRARHADELSELFFRCFDLMVRTRGTTIAVLRLHELYRLLQAHIGR